MRFYLNRSGQNEGPLEEAAITAMIQRGEVPPTAYICPEGGSAWQPLSSHPPFAAPAAPARPAPAAPAQKPVAATMAMDSAMIQAAARQSQAGLGQSPVAGMRPPGGFGPGPGTPPPGGFAPQGAMGPNAFTPPPVAMGPAGAPAQKKNNLPLILGGGCGVLLLIFLCGVCGVWFANR